MQPVIGTEDEEYTVSAFFDKSSQVIDYFSLKRKLSGDGFTLEAQVVDFDCQEILLSLSKVFKPVGPTNFQFRMDGEKPKLLEINPRISSATSIRSGFGYNESLMSINYFLDNKIPQKLDKRNIINKRAIRYMEDYIFS
jgi:carbamoyl-phosphate synthase large subunit